MCSIAGSPDYKKVNKMLQLQKHRSPDGNRLVVDSPYSIGMGRLSIIDLKSENLILYHEDEYYLSFNGEIYNYLEIRKELKDRGWKFATKSDTEVLLKSWRQWGEDMFDKFNGMFAFAIYDTKRQKIILARDIAGEKPLYYKKSPFEFASEAKALGFKCEEFPPANYGVYDLKSKRLTIKPYWTLKPIKISNDPVSELEALIKDSVKLRTRSDVPYGLYYSGGVDSSLISTFHDFKYKFTYKNGDYAKEFKKVFPKILWHLDYPVEHFSPFAMWKLAEMASKKVKVVISGEGADELFGGYIRYVLPDFNSRAQEYFPSYKNMFEPAESVHDAGWREFNGNMRVLLRMQDRMSSALGLENRCIFLDKRIIEFAFSLSDSWKILGFETKVILKQILFNRNPKFKDFEKTGLFCNVNKWLGVPEEGFGKKTYMKLQKDLWTKFRSNAST